MARRRYGEVTSGSGKSHQGRRITMAQPVSSIMIHMPKSGRSIAHNRENGRYFVEKVHIYKESYWNSWKPADTHIISSDWNPIGTATIWHIKLYNLRRKTPWHSMLTCARYINYKVAQVSRSAEETRVYVAKSIRLSETLHWSGLTSIHSLHFRSITHRSCIFSRRPWSTSKAF